MQIVDMYRHFSLFSFSGCPVGIFQSFISRTECISYKPCNSTVLLEEAIGKAEVTANTNLMDPKKKMNLMLKTDRKRKVSDHDGRWTIKVLTPLGYQKIQIRIKLLAFQIVALCYKYISNNKILITVTTSSEEAYFRIVPQFFIEFTWSGTTRHNSSDLRG